MNTFAGITEGITDQKVIKNILAGYFNPDITINWLQPLEDETDTYRQSSDGGWELVLKYCESDEFKEAFQLNLYVIIQIDTDVSPKYGVPHQDQGIDILPDKLIQLVIEKIKNRIGEEFYEENQERIIFAITVHSVECWLLPLHCKDNKKDYKKAALNNCLYHLKEAIKKADLPTIKKFREKDPKYYELISRQYSKRKTLINSYKHNPSLKIFIEEIEKRNIVLEEF